MFDLCNLKEKHFYIANVTTHNFFNDSIETIRTVVKCTQIQDFTNTATGYINAHFKTCSGERIITFGGIYDSYRRNDGAEILEEITDDKLKDTTIIFTDDTHYTKEVNKNSRKEYSL